ncbi:hypothetical protein FKN01_29530 [Streptomyces sp. 130]|nr:hypothetical protein FKN01_29530 [Streptomyces sp. 130]
MSSLALLVVLLLVLVAVLVLGALAYLAHGQPRRVAMLTLALCGAAVPAAIVVPIAVRCPGHASSPPGRSVTRDKRRACLFPQHHRSLVEVSTLRSRRCLDGAAGRKICCHWRESMLSAASVRLFFQGEEPHRPHRRRRAQEEREVGCDSAVAAEADEVGQQHQRSDQDPA